MLKTDLIKVTVHADGRLVDLRFYGPDADADHKRVDVTGFAARLITEELERRGEKGRARSGLEKLLCERGGFGGGGDVQRNFAFALDRIARDFREGKRSTYVRCVGVGGGRVVERLASA